jgi:hypothetical protein
LSVPKMPSWRVEGGGRTRHPAWWTAGNKVRRRRNSKVRVRVRGIDLRGSVLSALRRTGAGRRRDGAHLRKFAS